MGQNRVLSNRQIARASFVVVGGFLAGGVLGFIRTAIFSSMFGATSELGAFYTAQQIPEMLFTLVAGGALGSSFLPVFARYLARDDIEGGWRLASAVMTLSSVAAAVLGVVLVLSAPLYMPILYSRPVYQDLAIHLTQMMLVTTLIFSISGLLMGILNAHQNFFLPALALSVNNLGLIVGAVVIAPILPLDSGIFAYERVQPLVAFQFTHNTEAFIRYLAPASVNIYGLALGAILGALLHLTVQIPGLRPISAKLRLLPDWRIEGVREVLRLMLPRAFGLGVTRINFLVSFFFANLMILGSETAFNTAWFLTFFVLGIIAQGAGTAVFPTLSALAAANDLDGYRDRLSVVMRAVLFLAIPASIGLIIAGEPVIALLFERGEWTGVDTTATAWALSFFAIGIAGHSLLEVLSRAFYALSDTVTPVTIGVVSLLSNIVLNVVFIQIIGDPDTLERGPFAGLALANSLTTLIEAAVLWWILSRRIHGLNDRFILKGALKVTLAAAIMGGILILVIPSLTDFNVFVQVSLVVVIGGGFFFGASALLGVPEARSIPLMVLRRIRR